MKSISKNIFNFNYLVLDDNNISKWDNKIIDKILSFGNLPKGWDFGYGVPASNDTIATAICLARYGTLQGFNINARPETSGGIILSFFIDDDFIDLTIYPNNRYDIRHEKGIGEDYDILFDAENISLDCLFNKLNTIKQQPWFSLEHCILKNTTNIDKGSLSIVSKVMERESPYFRKNVLRQITEEPQFVTIYQSTIQPQLESQLSFVE